MFTMQESQLAQIHEKTVEILTRHGIYVNDRAPAEELAFFGASFAEHPKGGFVVKLTEGMIEKALRSAPEAFLLAGRDPARSVTVGEPGKTVMLPFSGTLYKVDRGGRRVRASWQDFIDSQKLSYMSDEIDVSSMLTMFPKEKSGAAGMFDMIIETILDSDKPLLGSAGNGLHSAFTMDALKCAMGGLNGYYAVGTVNSLSPLAWDVTMLDSIRVFAQHNQPILMACCSTAGVTSHIDLPVTLLTCNAEVLFGLVYAQMIHPGVPVIYGLTSAVADFATMGLCIGAPETAVLSAMTACMARYYKLPYRSGGGLNDAKCCDPQAAYESYMSLWNTFEEDVDFCLHGLGILESFNAFSFDKMIMDEEIIRYIKRYRSLNFDDYEWKEGLVEKIAEDGHYYDYMTDRATLKGMRKAFLRPVVSDRGSCVTWFDEDRSFIGNCEKVIEKRLSAYERPQIGEDAVLQLEALKAEYLAKLAE